MTGNYSDDTDRSLRPFGAHTQGIGIGLVLGNIAALAHGLHYPVAAVAVVLITVGYYFDKRSQRAGTERDNTSENEVETDR